ncbi:glycerol-3-phosphate dehydrogenase/oxidase [Mycetocola lacteus]|uniref:Glycerol-3-phosphate dehydrogenase/oxidase n=1 Tax=Mycetocola lacteus TaxID=76637 RepID=A0A3L7AHB9_9MICO|nr:glycerol-3-phosphate dehydrogenase/oxidase [Mycetocola lacteus]RLP79876.1 glycerol-3-phosphate dehydrogenase/oxidase [Mycetocola lacteus]
MQDQVGNPGTARTTVEAVRAEPRANVLIIGAGINGIATFRDLALQGVNVTLIERNDFCSGASAASSHMIHGGIRYLENGEFRLVQESVQERNSLIKIAPHYVKPLPTTVPIFSTFSGMVSAPMRFLTHKQGKPKERGAALIKMGLIMYDSFSRDGGSVPRHRFLGKKKTLAELPQLNQGLKYTATYFDASMHDPERLALDVMHDGLAAGDHARAVNYVEAVGSTEAGAITLRDRVTGEEFDFTADVVVNTSGPWTDLTNGAFGTPTTYMGGTKGSHIVLENDELLAATGGREIFFEHNDGRIVLIYPLKGKVMVGTTDINADPREAAVCTEEEVDYFFDLVKHVFPKISVDRSQIIYRFSGIRPLPGHGDTQPGFVSRDYRIVETAVGKTPLLSLVGGKWTTFRALAEHLSGDVLKVLGVERKVSTAGMAIGGGKDYPRDDAARARWVSANRGLVSDKRADALLERYGTRAAALIAQLPADEHMLATAPDYSAEELTILATEERVVTLLDVIQRRTSLAFTGRSSHAVLVEVAEAIASSLGWDTEATEREIARAAEYLSWAHGITDSRAGGKTPVSA